MKRILFLMPLFLFSMSMGYAEPLDDIQTSVLNYENNTATIQITWNQDEKATQYQIGCVSCIPNTVEFTPENNIIIDNVTPLPNGSIAILYVLAYDLENEIITGKQIFIYLEQ